MSKRTANYKPLLFTTTMRNPERLKDFLIVLKKYDGKILSKKIIKSVVKDLIGDGLYKPTIVSKAVKAKWKSETHLEEKEVNKIFKNNPQRHKEAGFEKGWPSRFDTWYKLAKELGFVYYLRNEKIEFSESGNMLIDEQHPENEHAVFANAFAKYQRHNPFRRILNKNVPLILLIQVIELLNSDKKYNGTGISRKEIPLLLCWRNDVANALYKKIKALRKKYRYTPSDEIILEKCKELLENGGKVTKMDNNSILVDYPDEFIRKMKLTGLITLKGYGKFIDINHKEAEAIEYIKKNYSTYQEFKTEKSFFNFIGTVDHKLISTLTTFKAPGKTTKKELDKWIKYYSWEMIKNEMIILAKNKSSKDEVLKVISAPLRLEFLTSLAILNRLPKIDVKPNYVSDDEGLPTSHAPGGNVDIECAEITENILIEVTLLTGTQQTIREMPAIQRHLKEIVATGKKAFSLFVPPKVYSDSCEYASFVKHKDKNEIRILDIELFLKQLENCSTLNEVAYSADSCV